MTSMYRKSPAFDSLSRYFTVMRRSVCAVPHEVEDVHKLLVFTCAFKRASIISSGNIIRTVEEALSLSLSLSFPVACHHRRITEFVRPYRV